MSVLISDNANANHESGIIRLIQAIFLILMRRLEMKLWCPCIYCREGRKNRARRVIILIAFTVLGALILLYGNVWK